MKFDLKNYENMNNHHLKRRISHHHNPFTQDISREEVRFKHLRQLLTQFILILIELLVVILIAFYFISPLNYISKISVNGNRTIPKNNITHFIRTTSNNSIFKLMIHKDHIIRAASSQNVQLRSFHLNVYKWNHIYIKISEYPVVAYLHHRNKYYAVVKNGQRSHKATKPDQIYPILTGFKSPDTLKVFVSDYKKLPDSVKPDIDKIKFTPTSIDPDRIYVYMSDGNQIYANYKDWSHKMRYYSAISKSMKKHGIINMEFGTYSKKI